MNAPDTHVVEWSDTKHSFRIRSLSDVLTSNTREFFEGSVREYAPLGVFNSSEDAVRFVQARARSSGDLRSFATG